MSISISKDCRRDLQRKYLEYLEIYGFMFRILYSDQALQMLRSAIPQQRLQLDCDEAFVIMDRQTQKVYLLFGGLMYRLVEPGDERLRKEALELREVLASKSYKEENCSYYSELYKLLESWKEKIINLYGKEFYEAMLKYFVIRDVIDDKAVAIHDIYNDKLYFIVNGTIYELVKPEKFSKKFEEEENFKDPDSFFLI
jgi:hypothetical protein